MLRTKIHLASCLALLLCSCATTGIQVPVMRPAPVNLGQFSLVAVDKFTGKGCDEVAADFSVALRDAINPLTGEADFEVLSRFDIDTMLDELQGRHSRGLEGDVAELLQKWSSAELVLKGDVGTYMVEEEVVEKQWRDQDGYFHGRMTRSCIAYISVQLTATTTDRDRIFDKVRLDDTAVASTTAIDGKPEPIDHEALLAVARQRVVDRYLRRILPHQDWVTVHLYTDGYLPGLQVGNSMARTGDWYAALESYREAHERATGELAGLGYMALYNMGVAYEYTNQFDESRKALKQAYALEQDSMILGEMQRLAYREQEYGRLVEQGAWRSRNHGHKNRRD